ncbi:CRE-SRD-5 protein [Caenorhabditis remanei]|uniref:CRE-SRD-5 protein n=1 Tax=Caenorhabditis remanei TaxID=31234 RepID=E3MQY4_CAERE|nr:CRE-SRD-5 protein [Caenorhabditis remanei]
MSLIFVIFHTTLSLIGCVLNSLLCYVAAWKSPTVIKTYSIITVNFAITNLAICVVNFVLQMRMIPIEKTIIFVSYGPCQWLNNRICFDLYSVLVHVYTHTIWLLFVSFCYRYYVMVKSEPSKTKVNLLLLIIYIPSFFQMILLFFDFTDPSILLKIQQSLVPQYNLKGLMIFGIADSTSFNAMFSIIHVAVMSTPIVLCIVVLRKKILKKMSFKGVEVNSNTRTLQLQLLRALTVQAIIPCFYLIGVVSYFISRLKIYRDPFFEYLIFSAFLFVPVLSPISAFTFVTPYRKWLLRACHLSIYRVESEKNETTKEVTNETRWGQSTKTN